MLLPILAACTEDPDRPGRPDPTTEPTSDPTGTPTPSETGWAPSGDTGPAPGPCEPGDLRAEGVGGLGSQQVVAVAGTADGGTVAAGTFFEELVLDPGGPSELRVTGSGAGGFLVALDAAGARRWVTTFAADGLDLAGVAVTADGDVAVGGAFLGAGTFGEGADAQALDSTDWDGFVARYGGDGALRGVATATGAGRNRVTALAALGDDVVAAGDEAFADAAVVGGVPIAPDPDRRTAWVARFDPRGRATWVTPMSGPAATRFDGLDARPGLGVAVVGTIDRPGTLPLPGPDLRADLDPSGLVRLDEDGHPLGGSALGGFGYGVALGDDGSAWVTGSYQPDLGMPFGRGRPGAREAPRGPGDSAAFVARFAPDGALASLTATRARAADGWSFGTEVAADGDGALVVGTYGDRVSLPGPTGTPVAELWPAGRGDGFLARVDADGFFACGSGIAGPGDDVPVAVARLADGAFAVVGVYQREVTLGVGPPGAVTLPSLYPESERSDGYLSRWTFAP